LLPREQGWRDHLCQYPAGVAGPAGNPKLALIEADAGRVWNRDQRYSPCIGFGLGLLDSCFHGGSGNNGMPDTLDKCPTKPAGGKIGALVYSLTMPLLVQFDTSVATIKPVSWAELDAFVAFLKAVPSAKGELQGHTDNVGKTAYNLELSQDRADPVKAYVVGKGVDAGHRAMPYAPLNGATCSYILAIQRRAKPPDRFSGRSNL
jgi:hypothetical protein